MYRALTFMMLGAVSAITIQVMNDERASRDFGRARRKLMAKNRKFIKRIM